MAFTVQLLFDQASDATIRSVWEKLETIGMPLPLNVPGNRPHISLVTYNTLDVAACTNRLRAFAQTIPPLALSSSHLGLFNEAKTVLFLAPIVNASLLDLHAQVHHLLQDLGPPPATYYLPGHWTPHCTLAMQVPPQLVSQAVAIGLEIPLPLPLAVEEIGMIEHPPLKQICAFRLTGGQ